MKSFFSSFVLQNAQFTDCSRGVLMQSSNYYANSEIDNVIFKNCEYGILGGTLWRRNLEIHNCRFTDNTKSSINLGLTQGSNILIYDNLINYSFSSGIPTPDSYNSSTEGEHGIYIHNAFSGIKQNLSIYNNSITNKKNAIVLQNINWDPSTYLAPIISNRIKIQTPYNSGSSNPPISTAILIENCKNISSYQNIFLRDGTQEIEDGLEGNQIRGINLRYSQVPLSLPLNSQPERLFIFDNHFQSVSNSVHFEGSCLGYSLACNKMIDCFYGVTLGSPSIPTADISTQIAAYYTFDPQNTWEDANCVDYTWRVNGVNVNTGCIWNHIGYPTNPTASVYPNTTHCTGVTPSHLNGAPPNFCPLQPDVEQWDISAARETLLGSIIRDEIDYSENSLMYKMWARVFAWNVLMECPEMLEVENENEANEQYSEFFEEMMTGNNKLFLDVQNFIHEDDYDNALDVLENIEPADEAEELLKYCFSVYLENDMQGENGNYDETTFGNISDIAHLNPYNYGEAVFMARGMLQLVLQDNEVLRKRAININANKDASNHLVNNPVLDFLEIHTTKINEFENATAIIYSGEGKKLLESGIDQNISTINVTQLPSGIYFLSLHLPSGEIISDKFIKTE